MMPKVLLKLVIVVIFSVGHPVMIPIPQTYDVRRQNIANFPGNNRVTCEPLKVFFHLQVADLVIFLCISHHWCTPLILIA